MNPQPTTAQPVEKIPGAAALAQAVPSCLPLAKQWAGTVYRYADTDWANKNDFLSGAGATKADGRWSLREWQIALANTALDPYTAQREAFSKAVYYGWPLESVLPMVLGAASVCVDNMLDLTDAAILAKLGVTTAMICDLDWRRERNAGKVAFTQLIGRAAWDAGFDSLMAPSAAAHPHGGGQNLLYFPKRLATPPKIVNAEKMPPPPRR